MTVSLSLFGRLSVPRPTSELRTSRLGHEHGELEHVEALVRRAGERGLRVLRQSLVAGFPRRSDTKKA